jgi:hypothetical protein
MVTPVTISQPIVTIMQNWQVQEINKDFLTTFQYSLAQILGIGAAAVFPMALLGWVADPFLAPYIQGRAFSSAF